MAIFDIPWVVVYLAVIWLCHPLLGMAAASASALMLLLAFANDRPTRADIETLRQEAPRSTRYLESSMQNAETVMQFGMVDALMERWCRLKDSVAAQRSPRQARATRPSLPA